MTSPTSPFALQPIPIANIDDIEYLMWMIRHEHPGSARALSEQWHERGNQLYRVMLAVSRAKNSLEDWESPEAFDAYETRSDGVHNHALDLRNAAHDIGAGLTELANVMEAGQERMEELYSEYNSSMSTWDSIVRRHLDDAGMEWVPVDEAYGHYTLTIDPDGELWQFEESSLVGNGDNYSAGDRGAYRALWVEKVKSVALEVNDSYVPGLSKLSNAYISIASPYDYVFHPGGLGIEMPDPGAMNPGTVPTPPPPGVAPPPGPPGTGLVDAPPAPPPPSNVGIAPPVNPAVPPGVDPGVQPLTTPAPPTAPGVEVPPVVPPPVVPPVGLGNQPGGSVVNPPGSQQANIPPPPNPGVMSTNLDGAVPSVLSSNNPALDPTGQPLPPGSVLSPDPGGPPGAPGLSVDGPGADPPGANSLSGTVGMPLGGMGMGMPPGAGMGGPPGATGAQRNTRGSAPPGTGVGAVPGAAGDGTLPPGAGMGAAPGTPGQRRQPPGTPTGTGTPSPAVPEAFLPPGTGAPPVLGDPQRRQARPGSAAEAPPVTRPTGRRGAGSGTPPVLVNKHHTGPRRTYTEQRQAERSARQERLKRFQEILKSSLAKDLPEGTAPVLDGRLAADGAPPERAAEVPAALRGVQPAAADPHARPVPPADQATRRPVTEQPAAPVGAEPTGPAAWEVETPGGPVVSGEQAPKRPEEPPAGTVRPA